MCHAAQARRELDRAATQALREAGMEANAAVRPLADAAGKAHAGVAVIRAETVRTVLAAQ